MQLFQKTKSRFRRLLSGVTASALAFSALAGIPEIAPIRAEAATANWKFDLGGAGTASGYTGVSAGTGYSASTGYGFSGSVSDVTAGGSGALSDAVRFTGGEFRVDLPNGLYQVTVTTGNSPRTSITMEGMLQMINLCGNNAVESIQIPVTDGQLSIAAVAGMNNAQYTISAIEITQLNTTGEMKPTVWLCGDSTVANYYNQPDTSQHGWGQYLKDYINTNVFEVRNMAASGQYAKGFYDGGQFDAIKTYGKAGDYYVISIGINDTNYSNKDEYYTVVTEMVEIAKSKGMNVILVKQQGRRSDLNRETLLGGRWFGGQLDTIGAEQNVQVIDLFTAWQNFGIETGYDGMAAYYAANDDLHQSKLGAQKNAELVQGLMKIGDTAMDTSVYYTFKNTNSGMVMDIEGGIMADGTNLQQWGGNDLTCQQWELRPFAKGTTYYYVHSVADPNYVLKAMTGSDGGNLQIVPYATNDSMMLFQFTKVGDGSYYISTRSSRDACFVEVAGASTASGANVQQWSWTYSKCQNWQAEKIEIPTVEPTTEPTTEPPTEQTTEPPVQQPTDPAEPDTEDDITMGDFNKDGRVDAFDLAMLKKYMRTGEGFDEDQRRAADVSGDGNVDISDTKMVRDFTHARDVHFAKPAARYESVYYAVDQVWEDGMAETVNAGYTKEEGYVNLGNNDTSNITFTVQVAEKGNYMTHIRFANGSAVDRKMAVYVNGNTQDYWMQSFPGTGAWTTWTEIGLVLPLNAGENTIKFQSAVADAGAPNLDYIDLTLTDEPYAETYVPEVNEDVTDGTKPTVFILGDSTVQSYRASYAPQQGWGYYLADYFTEDVTVDNRSMAGRSTKKAYDEGRWQSLADSLKEGDYVMIQFAINDSGASNADRYAPTCGNVDNPTEGSYEWYMTQFINDAKAKGATPILVTTVIGMKAYNSSTGQFTNSYSNYCDACKNLSKKYSIPCIDLNTIMKDHYNSVGYDTAKSYHLMGAVEGSTDGTHFCETGANVVAGLVANAVKNQKIAGLSGYVK